MRFRISPVILSCIAAFALVAGFMLGGCATADTANLRTKNLLSGAGFHARKPETPEQQKVYAEMPDHQLQGGIVHGNQLYIYKVAKEGVVYVGGETEYQKYVRLLAKWNRLAQTKAPSATPSGKQQDPFLLLKNPFDDHALWTLQYMQ